MGIIAGGVILFAQPRVGEPVPANSPSMSVAEQSQSVEMHAGPTDETKPVSSQAPISPDPGILPALDGVVIPVPQVPTNPDILPAVHTIPVPDIDHNTGGCHCHGPGYQWLTGELHYLYVRNVWQLHYAESDDDCRFTGSVILSTTKPMSGFHDGEMVRVEGAMLDRGEPTYQAISIRGLPQTANQER